jgi:hypothetical protein
MGMDIYVKKAIEELRDVTKTADAALLAEQRKTNELLERVVAALERASV